MSAQQIDNDFRHIITKIEEQRPKGELLHALGITETQLDAWSSGNVITMPFAELRLQLYAIEYGLSNLFIERHIELPSFDIFRKFSFTNEPIGYDVNPVQQLKLKSKPTKIGGFVVNYPLGIPAGALTGTYKWIEHYSRRGFDVLTYKTVRTKKWDAHEFPNWVFISNAPSLTSRDVQDEQKRFIWTSNYRPDDATQVTMANSVGIPSPSPDEWMEDIEKAKASLLSGQVLIVSVTGTSEPGDSFNHLRDDYVSAAKMAKQAGADIVELNISCPNVKGRPEGYVYRSPEDSSAITKAVRKALGEEPFIKIAYLPYQKLADVVRANAPYIGGVTAINTISMPVRDNHNNDVFPPKPIPRKVAGISGSAIKHIAQEVVENLNRLREHNHYEYDILAVGGVMNQQDEENYYTLGATAVQSCTGAFINPGLAIDIRSNVGNNITPLSLTTNNGIEIYERGKASMLKEHQTKSRTSAQLGVTLETNSDDSENEIDIDERSTVEQDRELIERLTDVEGIKGLLLSLLEKRKDKERKPS